MPKGQRTDGQPHKPNGNAPDKRPWSKTKPEDRPSPRGKENPVVDHANWRQPPVAPDQIKFDDEAKGRFLAAILKHGKRALAAKEALVSMQTVRNHMKWDPEFEELFNQAMAERADRVTRQIEEEALEGFEEPIFHAKTGELLGTKKVYETPIRLAILKRYDPEYKDRSETTINGTVGVLVAPAQMSPQAWIEQEAARNTTRVEPDKDNLGPPPGVLIDANPR